MSSRAARKSKGKNPNFPHNPPNPLVQNKFWRLLAVRRSKSKSIRRVRRSPQRALSIKVKMDVENSGFPARYSRPDVVLNTRKFVFQLGGLLVDSFDIYACVGAGGLSTEQLNTLEKLANQVDIDLNVIRVSQNSAQKRDDADLALKFDMYNWWLSRLSPAPLFLITSDKDFLATIETLRNDKFTVIVAHNKDSATLEMRNLTDSYDWHSVAKGVLLIPGGNVMPQGQGDPPKMRPLPPSPPELSVVKVKVLWDVETTLESDNTQLIYKALPEGSTCEEIKGNLERELINQGFGGIDEIQIVAKSGTLSQQMILDMESSGFSVSTVKMPTRKKKNGEGYTDVTTWQFMYQWLKQQQYLIPVLLISNDTNLIGAVTSVVSFGYEIFLVHGPNAPAELVTAATKGFDWDDLVIGGDAAHN